MLKKIKSQKGETHLANQWTTLGKNNKKARKAGHTEKRLCQVAKIRTLRLTIYIAVDETK